jgi:hypothetical protein
MDRAKVVTALACAAAVALAIWPAFVYGIQRVSYDPTLAIYTITFMGIAWYTYYQRRTLQEQRSALVYAMSHDKVVREQVESDARATLANRRANLATAVLTELKPILFRLGNIVESGPESYHDPIAHPVLNESLRHTEVFDGPTVNRLAAVAFRLREVELLMTTFRELRQLHRDKDYEAKNVEVTTGNINLVKQSRHEEQQASADLNNVRLMLRAQASWAYNRVPALVESLLAAGCAGPPPDLETPVSDDTLPKLLPNPFVS